MSVSDAGCSSAFEFLANKCRPRRAGILFGSVAVSGLFVEEVFNEEWEELGTS
jgi:hypothetical protein